MDRPGLVAARSALAWFAAVDLANPSASPATLEVGLFGLTPTAAGVKSDLCPNWLNEAEIEFWLQFSGEDQSTCGPPNKEDEFECKDGKEFSLNWCFRAQSATSLDPGEPTFFAREYGKLSDDDVRLVPATRTTDYLPARFGDGRSLNQHTALGLNDQDGNRLFAAEVSCALITHKQNRVACLPPALPSDPACTPRPAPAMKALPWPWRN